MNSVSTPKITISWIVSTLMLLAFSAGTHALFQTDPTLEVAGAMSPELTIPLSIVLLASMNLVIHSLYYFGGFSSSPIKKGMGLSLGIGLVYLLVIMLCSNMISIHAPLGFIALNFLCLVVKMVALGLTISLLSISDFHRWGAFRWV